MSAAPKWEPFRPELFPAYCQFARATFGRDAYQASGHFLHWLYQGNPAASGFRDFLLAIEPQGRVVGCIHRMRLPWRVGDRSASFPSLQNLMIAEDHRQGLGFWLLKLSLHGEPAAVIPGVVNPLAQAYEGMKASRIPTQWLARKVVPSPTGAWRFLSLMRQPFRLHNDLRAIHGTAFGAFRALTIPSKDDLEVLARDLSTTENQNDFQVDWNEPLLRWRLFHRYGPPSLLLRAEGDARSWAVLSFGVRRRVPVARILHFRAGSANPSALLQAAAAASGRFGAMFVLCTSAKPNQQQALAQAGFRHTKVQPFTYFWQKDRTSKSGLSFTPLSTDIGFDGIPLEQ